MCIYRTRPWHVPPPLFPQSKRTLTVRSSNSLFINLKMLNPPGQSLECVLQSLECVLQLLECVLQSLQCVLQWARGGIVCIAVCVAVCAEVGVGRYRLYCSLCCILCCNLRCIDVGRYSFSSFTHSPSALCCHPMCVATLSS